MLAENTCKIGQIVFSPSELCILMNNNPQFYEFNLLIFLNN